MFLIKKKINKLFIFTLVEIILVSEAHHQPKVKQ